MDLVVGNMISVYLIIILELKLGFELWFAFLLKIRVFNIYQRMFYVYSMMFWSFKKLKWMFGIFLQNPKFELNF